MRFIKTKTEVGYAVMLLVMLLAFAALALFGVRIGLQLLLLIVGVTGGQALAYVATRSPHRRKARALVLVLLVYGAWLTSILVGALVGIQWLSDLADTRTLPGSLLFGFVLGVGIVAFGRWFSIGAPRDY